MWDLTMSSLLPNSSATTPRPLDTAIQGRAVKYPMNVDMYSQFSIRFHGSLNCALLLHSRQINMTSVVFSFWKTALHLPRKQLENQPDMSPYFHLKHGIYSIRDHLILVLSAS